MYLQQLVLLDVLEVLVGADLQFVGSLLVADDDAVGMHLQGADGPHVVDASLDGSLQGTGLQVTVGQDHHLTGVHHGANTYRQGMGGHVLGLATEETAVGDAGVSGEGLHTGTALERTAWLVEGNVTIGADTADEQVDAASLFDHGLILGALLVQVGGVTVQDVDVLLRTVNVVEEVTGHEGVVALGMRLGQTDILVHVEGDDVLERHLTGTVGLDEGIVHTYGRGTCGKAQNELVIGRRVELVDTLNDMIGCPLGQFLIV